MHPGLRGQPPCQGDLQDPEAEEVDIGRCDCVASTVECLQKHHAIGECDVSATEDSQAVYGDWHYSRIAREQADDPGGEDDKDNSDGAEEDHIPQAGSPDGVAGAVRMSRAEVLPNQGCSGVAQSPGRQDREDHDADTDRIAGHG